MNYYYKNSKNEWVRISKDNYAAMLMWRGDSDAPEMRESEKSMPSTPPDGGQYKFSRRGRKKAR